MWIDALLGPGLILLMITLVIWTAMVIIERVSDCAGKARQRFCLRGRAGLLRVVRGDFPQRSSLKMLSDDQLQNEQDADDGEQTHIAASVSSLRELEREQDALGLLLELVGSRSHVPDREPERVRAEDQADGAHRQVRVSLRHRRRRLE